MQKKKMLENRDLNNKRVFTAEGMLNGKCGGTKMAVCVKK